MRISDWSSDVCSSDLASLVVRVKMPTIPTREWKQMPFFMVAASHSPLLDFPARESSSVLNILAALEDRKSVVLGKSVSVRVDLGGRRSIKKKKTERYNTL